MRTWRSPMSATSQSAFVDISETSHSDISCIIKFPFVSIVFCYLVLEKFKYANGTVEKGCKKGCKAYSVPLLSIINMVELNFLQKGACFAIQYVIHAYKL